MKDCLFCQIVAGKIPAYEVYRDRQCLAFLDIRPLNPGHLLVVPKKHDEYLFDLDDTAYGEIFKITKRLAGPLKEATEAVRIGLVVEGFGIDHLHLHLVPIYEINQLDPNRAYTASVEELTKMRKKIKAKIK